MFGLPENHAQPNAPVQHRYQDDSSRETACGQIQSRSSAQPDMRLLESGESERDRCETQCLVDSFRADLSCGQKGIPQDKNQRLGILAIREERRSLRLRRLYHVTTHYMLCDLLTKYSGYFSRSLQELVTCGIWTVSGKVRVLEHFGKPSASAETSTGGILDI